MAEESPCGFRRDSCKRCAGVLNVKIDVSAEQSLVDQQCAAEIGFAFYADASAGFDVLSKEFGQDDLFGEEFGSNHELRLHGLAAGTGSSDCDQCSKADQALHLK